MLAKIVAIIYFLIKELPGYLEKVKEVRAETELQTKKEISEKALKLYKETKSLDALNELSK